MTTEIALGLLTCAVALLAFFAQLVFKDIRDDVKSTKTQLDMIRLQQPLVVTDGRMRDAMRDMEANTSRQFDKLREDLPGIVRLAIIDHALPPSPTRT